MSNSSTSSVAALISALKKKASLDSAIAKAGAAEQAAQALASWEPSIVAAVKNQFGIASAVDSVTALSSYEAMFTASAHGVSLRGSISHLALPGTDPAALGSETVTQAVLDLGSWSSKATDGDRLLEVLNEHISNNKLQSDGSRLAAALSKHGAAASKRASQQASRFSKRVEAAWDRIVKEDVLNTFGLTVESISFEEVSCTRARFTASVAGVTLHGIASCDVITAEMALKLDQIGTFLRSVVLKLPGAAKYSRSPEQLAKSLKTATASK